MSVTLSPIFSWPLVALLVLAVGALTVVVYLRRIRRTGGSRWQWIAFALRMIAVLLCLLAALRPSIILSETREQPTSVLVLVDTSSSMQIGDEINSQTRFEVARSVVERLVDQIDQLDEVDLELLRFDDSLRQLPPVDRWDETAVADASTDPSDDESDDDSDASDPSENGTEDRPQGDPVAPLGRTTKLGTGMNEAIDRRQDGRTIAAALVISDGASNAGDPPLSVAERFASLNIPVSTVGVGQSVGGTSRDIAVRSLVAGPRAFVKNVVTARAALEVNGFEGRPLDVELFVEGRVSPIARTTVTPQPGQNVVNVPDLKFTPQLPGEVMLTLRVTPQPGELIESNNAYSSFLNVSSGGVNVLYIQGNLSWEYRYLTYALDASPDIQVDRVALRSRDRRVGALQDEYFTPGRYDVYILGDVSAAKFTPAQLRLLSDAVDKGAGLAMLGGQDSFGDGGWASTSVADRLPIVLQPGDGQFAPDGGVRMTVDEENQLNYVLQIGPTPQRSRELWSQLPPMPQVNRFGQPKPLAIVMARSRPSDQPILVGQDGRGRTLAFGGDTWFWGASRDQEHRSAHRQFWRQAILWLAHREEQGEITVEIDLEGRRFAAGQEIPVAARALDAKRDLIPGVQFRSEVRYQGRAGQVGVDEGEPLPLEMFAQDQVGQGTFYDALEPGVYEITVNATKDGEPIGQDTARFIAFEDNRELENPAANYNLLEKIAQATDGQFLGPEQIDDFLEPLSEADYTQYVSRVEHRIWDNWPFFLAFVAVLTAEWVIRKRHGWV